MSQNARFFFFLKWAFAHFGHCHCDCKLSMGRCTCVLVILFACLENMGEGKKTWRSIICTFVRWTWGLKCCVCGFGFLLPFYFVAVKNVGRGKKMWKLVEFLLDEFFFLIGLNGFFWLGWVKFFWLNHFFLLPSICK